MIIFCIAVIIVNYFVVKSWKEKVERDSKKDIYNILTEYNTEMEKMEGILEKAYNIFKDEPQYYDIYKEIKDYFKWLYSPNSWSKPPDKNNLKQLRALDKFRNNLLKRINKYNYNEIYIYNSANYNPNGYTKLKRNKTNKKFVNSFINDFLGGDNE